MATVKISITLPDSQVREIRDMVADGIAASVSAFVQPAVGIGLSDASGWREMLDEALQQTGGPLTQEEIRWADAIPGCSCSVEERPQWKERRQQTRGMSGFTFDAGGLIAPDRNDGAVTALTERATQRKMRITVPTTALAQAICNPSDRFVWCG